MGNRTQTKNFLMMLILALSGFAFSTPDTCTTPFQPCSIGGSCCSDDHGTTFSCVKWGDNNYMCRDARHATCAKSDEWCHGSASKLDPYKCCSVEDKCLKVDEYNYKCGRAAPPAPGTCDVNPFEPCEKDDVCCDDEKGTKYSCVQWGDSSMMCRDDAHATCAKAGEWCHGAASKLAPHACCDPTQTCAKVDADNFVCK